MTTGIDWLRRQPWSTRLIMAAAFASASLFAWFMGYIWPWGYVMAVVPLVTPRRSSVDEEFSREVRATNESAPMRVRVGVSLASLEKVLIELAAATTKGFGALQIQMVMQGARELLAGHEKEFQLVVIFAGRPTSLQLTLRHNGDDQFELRALTDPKLAVHLKPQP